MGHTRELRAVVGLVILAALHGCATPRRNQVQMDAGRATRPDIMEKVARILDQQGYEVQERRDTGNVIQYMTSWTTRAPFEDEAMGGAFECRTRVTFEARKGAGDTFAISLKGENTIQRASFLDEWVSLPPTPMFRDHIREVADAIAIEVDVGVRTR